MINSVNSSADSFLLDIDRLQAKAERAQRQISSGLRVTKPSDDPDSTGAIVQSGSDIARNQQIGRNLDQVKVEVDTAEQALQASVSTLEQINVVGAQGANFDQTAATRNNLAVQVQNLLERLVGSANTSVAGRYVFSGDSDQTAPYGIDLTTVTGTTPYAGSAATRQVEDPRGGKFATSQSGQQIFDAAGGSVFAAVNALRVALLANDQNGITASLASLKAAHDHLSDSLSYYGTVQNEVDDGITAAKTLDVRLRSQLSNLRDADLAGASTDLLSAKLNLDAAFSARARVPKTSLFDYLG
jgi:flagellar hook-associated protein 3 FlgL